MYQLTLTCHERQAIDWIGDRYDHGTKLFQVLINSDHTIEWDSTEDVTFTLKEHEAWQIKDIADACEHRWDCFSHKFAKKLDEFIWSII